MAPKARSHLPADFAKRLRAAQSYSGLNVADFGAGIERSEGTLSNWMNERHAPKADEWPEILRRLVKTSGLPAWFFTAPSLKFTPRTAAGADEATREILMRLARLEERFPVAVPNANGYEQIARGIDSILDRINHMDTRIEQLAAPGETRRSKREGRSEA